MENERIGIIGAGFSGCMTAVQLIVQSQIPIHIDLFYQEGTLATGIAYATYSNTHLLNVITAKMSAYPDKPNHFLDWVLQQAAYVNIDAYVVANAFLPRSLYGKYLTEIWENAVQMASVKGIGIHHHTQTIVHIDPDKGVINLENGEHIKVNKIVLATGNQLPGNPKIKNMDYYRSKTYFKNPWHISSVQGLKNDLPVLIIGNGLTMVDTVFGLLEQGFKGQILSLSPNGFNILPHRHIGAKYTSILNELPENPDLYTLFSLIYKHVKQVRAFGISAEPIIDAIRPNVQKYWKNFTSTEKQLFMKRFRHLWGVARHRIPLQSYDKLQQLRIKQLLVVYAGKLSAIADTPDGVAVIFENKKTLKTQALLVQRVINCTGPEANWNNLKGTFLQKLIVEGHVQHDPFWLGIQTDTNTFKIKNAAQETHSSFYTLGSNLKGELWESTAVNELRSQAQQLAMQLLQHATVIV